MTDLIFILPNNGILLQRVDVEPNRLAEIINSGSYPLTVPEQALLAAGPTSLCAACLGGVVVAAPLARLKPRLPEVVLRRSGRLVLRRRVRTEPAPLTQRQREVIQCLAEGLNTLQIAAKMGLSIRAVQYHIDRLKRMYSASSRAQIVDLSSRAGEI